MNVGAVSSISAQIRHEALAIPAPVRPEDTPVPKDLSDPPAVRQVEKGEQVDVYL